MAQLPQVDTLVLVSSRYRSDYLQGVLTQLSNIEYLTIDYPIEYEELPQLKALPNLKELTIHTDSFSPLELEKLGEEFSHVKIKTIVAPLQFP